MKLISLFLLIACVQSSPVRTSLCCCGCTEEPCPIVGFNCPHPQMTCSDEEREGVVHCRDLQRLWDTATTAEKPEERRPTDSVTAFIGHTGRFNRFGYSLSGQQKPEISDTELLNKNVVYRDQNGTTEIRFSPPKATMTKIEKDFANLDKMQLMLNDLQSMISTVKGLIDREVGPKSETLTKEETVESLPEGVDNISEEEERQAIDDVIMRMKGAFRKMTKDELPVTEIDSSMSSPVLDMQSLPLVVMNSRPKRAAKKNAGNCNDEQLRELIDNNIGSDAKNSKRQIQRAAEKEFGGTFNVICSPCEFSFVISSQKYCEGFKDQVACFVFLQPPTSLKRIR